MYQEKIRLYVTETGKLRMLDQTDGYCYDNEISGVSDFGFETIGEDLFE